ncbi:hypothetical protein BH24ACT11_BH24ACT11_19800 [soil metagenome]
MTRRTIRRPARRLSLAAAAVWFALSYGGAILGYLAVNAFAARMLRDDFGYFVIAISVSTVVGQLGLFGAHRGGLREAARLQPGDDDRLRELRRAVRVVSAVTLPLTAAVTTAVTLAVMTGVDAGTRWSVAAGMGVLVWFGGQQKLWANYLRGFGRVRFASLLEGRSGGAFVALCQGLSVGAVLLLAAGSGLPGALAAMAVGFAIPVLLAWCVVARHWRHLRVGFVSIADVRAVVTKNRHFASNMLGGSLNSYLETWIAGLVLTGASVSLFSAAHRLSLLLTISIVSLGVVFSPVVSRLSGQGDGGLEPLLRTGATLATAVTAVLFLPMLVVPGPLLGAVYGDSFAAAAPMLVVLTLGAVSSVLTGMCAVALTMSQHEAVVAKVQWAAVVVRAGLGAILALQFGALGLAVSAAIVTSGLSVTFLLLTRRRLGIWTQPTLRPDLGLMRRTAG